MEHLPAKSVEYIHFLDSDDWLELDCIEECVKSALENQAEIVWHGIKIYDNFSQTMRIDDYFSRMNLTHSSMYSGIEILKMEKGIFFWAPKGLIMGDKLKKIRFEEEIFFEDALFGIQLFIEINRILILHHAYLFYRVRANSICQHTLKEKYSSGDNVVFSKSQCDIVDAFRNNQFAQIYIFCYAMAITALKLLDMIRKIEFDVCTKRIVQDKIEECTKFAFDCCTLPKDPRNIREICSKLLAYTSKVRWSSKLAYYCPSIFRILKGVKNIIKK